MLRKAIPAHCFERSLWRSCSYLALDLLMAAALYWCSTCIDSAPVPAWSKWAGWVAYWWFQGAVCTGLWVIAHECGHQAFSRYQAVNDGVGLVVHSCLLVPYFSWKHSHRRHHSNTGCVAKDEVFVPPSREEPHEGFEWGQLGVVRAAGLVVTLTLGWFAYLFANATSRPYDRFACHFDPWSPIFSKRERAEVVVSDAALVAVLAVLGRLGAVMGWGWLVKSYVVPYFIVNFWLVMITLLQHTHNGLPHYTESEWDWLRGALATVDRSYGPMLNWFHHHIADTHVAHHLFSQMPHYHAQEATEALKPVLGPYYQSDSSSIWAALWHDWATCRYVAPDAKGGGVLWFRK